MPPKGVSLLQTSCSVRFTASKLSLLIMGHSSHTIMFVFLNNSAVFEFFSKLQTSLSFTVRGILNLECAVLPPGRRVAAIPDDATATAIFPVLLTIARIVLVVSEDGALSIHLIRSTFLRLHYKDDLDDHNCMDFYFLFQPF